MSERLEATMEEVLVNLTNRYDEQWRTMCDNANKRGSDLSDEECGKIEALQEVISDLEGLIGRARRLKISGLRDLVVSEPISEIDIAE